VLIVKNPRNLEIHPLPGKQLPTDWRHQAAARAAEADRNYTSAIENAWAVAHLLEVNDGRREWFPFGFFLSMRHLQNRTLALWSHP
jgi:hypothetical protein